MYMQRLKNEWAFINIESQTVNIQPTVNKYAVDYH